MPCRSCSHVCSAHVTVLLLQASRTISSLLAIELSAAASVCLPPDPPLDHPLPPPPVPFQAIPSHPTSFLRHLRLHPARHLWHTRFSSCSGLQLFNTSDNLPNFPILPSQLPTYLYKRSSTASISNTTCRLQRLGRLLLSRTQTVLTGEA